METAAHPRLLFKPRTLGMIFVTLASSALSRTGVVKTFRCADETKLPGCYLRVAGTDFDPDSYLAATSLKAISVWHIGDPLAAVGPRASRTHEWSGFTCDVSDSDGQLDLQVDDAVAFLTLHRDDLLLLSDDPSVEDRRLDFGFDSRLGVGEIAVQGEWLPVNFLQLVGELQIGVALSLYPSSAEDL